MSTTETKERQVTKLQLHFANAFVVNVRDNRLYLKVGDDIGIDHIAATYRGILPIRKTEGEICCIISKYTKWFADKKAYDAKFECSYTPKCGDILDVYVRACPYNFKGHNGKMIEGVSLYVNRAITVSRIIPTTDTAEYIAFQKLMKEVTNL